MRFSKVTGLGALVVCALTACSKPAAREQTAGSAMAAAVPPPGPPAPPTTGTATGSGADITKPCTMITAAEVGAILGFAVTTVDEGYRCKFTDSKGGYLTLKLMESTSRSARDICEYAPDKRTVVAGVGDSASYFGATACVKLGDVAIIVDGPDLADSSDALHKSGAQNPEILVAKTVASRIP